MGTNGFQEPAIGFENGKIVGTKRLYTDGKFGTEDGRAHFMAAQWRGLQAPGKEQEQATFPFLINNGRTNHVWQSAYLDQDNDFVMDRWPYPFIEMNPDDMAELGVKEGDLVEVYNDNGSTQAMVYPTPTAQARRDLHAVRLPDAACRATSSRPGVNEFIIPNYKQTWGNIRKIADAPAGDPAPVLQVAGVQARAEAARGLPGLGRRAPVSLPGPACRIASDAVAGLALRITLHDRLEPLLPVINRILIDLLFRLACRMTRTIK